MAWGEGMLSLSGPVDLVLLGEHDAGLGRWMAELADRYSHGGLEVRISRRTDRRGHGWLLVPAGGSAECPVDAGGPGYALAVTGAGAACRGVGEAGLRHGWLTLMQLIELRLSERRCAIPCCTVADRPRQSHRMIHLCVFPEMPKDRIRQLVRLAGLLKYSHVVLEFWGTLAFETLPQLSWPESWRWSKAEARELMAMARAFGLEVVPMFNAMGHAAASRIRWGRHVVLDQAPELADLFEPDGWTWCAAEPRAQAILRSVADELVDLAGPGGWFHIGCDEAHSFAACDRCRTRDTAGLFAEHVNGLAAHLRGTGRRAIMWGDGLLECAAWPGSIALSPPWLGTHRAIGLLDRSIAIADWQYDAKNGQVGSIDHFRSQGFDVFAAPWFDHRNIRTMARAANQAGALGTMLTTWHRLPQFIEALPNAAMAMWEADPEADPGRYEKQNCVMQAYLAAHQRRLGPAGTTYATAGWMANEVPDQE
jgi:hypothetical protein